MVDRKEASCQMKFFTQGLWNSPFSLKCWLNSSIFGIAHGYACSLLPENPAKRKQPRSNALEACVLYLYLFTLALILKSYVSLQNQSWLASVESQCTLSLKVVSKEMAMALFSMDCRVFLPQQVKAHVQQALFLSEFSY